MIKAAAVAGLGAWTAPVIIDSLASPAAAGTAAPGCYRYLFQAANNCGTATPGTRLPLINFQNSANFCSAPSDGTCSSTTNVNVGDTGASFINVTSTTCGNGANAAELHTATLGIVGGFSCRIIDYKTVTNTFTCSSTNTVNTTSLVLPTLTAFNTYNYVYVIVKCP
jgi:hypothetical protein